MSDTTKITKISVDKDACIGCATCTVVCPQAFELDAENKSSVKEGALQASEEELLTAVQSCPVSAIKFENSEGGK